MPLCPAECCVWASRDPEMGRDPRQQLGETERLDDVVDRARLEAEHDIDLRVARGEHDHGDRRVLAGGVHGDDRAIAVGQTEVEQHEVGRIVVDRLDRGRDRADGRRFVTVRLERSNEAGRDQRVVLDHQHAARHGHQATNISDICDRMFHLVSMIADGSNAGCASMCVR